MGYSTILRRAIVCRAVPPLLVLAMFGLTIKTLVGILSGSAFVYVKPAASLAITTTAVILTVCWALRTARREDPVFAKA